MPSKHTPDSIGLTELIYQVKRELLSPDSRRADPIPLFAVEQIELEIAIIVDRTLEGGINIQVLSVGADKSRQDAQTVRVTLRPLRSREELISDLQQQDPQLFEEMTEESLNLLKGAQQDRGQMSWP
jgi:hypothetical protein